MTLLNPGLVGAAPGFSLKKGSFLLVGIHSYKEKSRTRWQLRIDNYWKFRFHEKIKTKRKMRERIKKIIIDYQMIKNEAIGSWNTLSIVK